MSLGRFHNMLLDHDSVDHRYIFGRNLLPPKIFKAGAAMSLTAVAYILKT